MHGVKLTAGVDEAGRGPLAGPVYAAAVILDPAHSIFGLDDSKKLSEKRRQQLQVEIKRLALCWSIATASVEEIYEINILQASLLAMRRAVAGLNLQPNHVLVDGNKLPELPCAATAVVGGDSIHPEISAASILAKQARDKEMISLAEDFPQYGFEKHKGYPTKAHILALQQHGITQYHRKSFSPVRKLIEGINN